MTSNADVDAAASDVSLHTSRVRFSDSFVDVERDRQVAFAARRFTVMFHSGRKRGKREIRLDTYPIHGIAADAARVLWEESQPGGRFKSIGMVYGTVQALRQFAQYVDAIGGRGRIRCLRDIAISDIDDFEKFLRTKGASPGYTYSRVVALRLLLELANEHGLIDPAILPRLNYVSNNGIGGRQHRGNPREPYTCYVAQQLRDACLKDIEEAVDRITLQAPALLCDGGDPRHHGWNSAPNVLWAMVHRGLASVQDNPPSVVRALATLRSRSGYARTFPELLRLVHLTADDVVAFATFLSLETGLPIECVGDLRADCLANGARGYVDIQYTKKRRGSGSAMTMRVKTEERHSPGAIIRLILTLTKTSRNFADAEAAQYLFVGYNRIPIQGRLLFRLDVTGHAVIRFSERHDIRDDAGKRISRVNMTRLRKTYKAEQYVRVNGHLADAANDHTTTVHANHYANVAALLPLHENAIAAGLQQAYDAAFTSIIVNGDRERRLQTHPEDAANDLGISPAQAQAIVSGSADVWMASCRDFDHSPHSDEGRCQRPVWGCLECRNAIVTSSKLPAILAFLNHALERRQQMNMAAWVERYGRAYARITHDILPRFPAKDIALAKATVEAGEDMLWLPAELTMSL